MAYNEPGVRVIQEVAEGALSSADSDLPTCIIGPLYSILTQESAGSFDPLSGSAQDYEWPNAPAGSLVDISGTMNGIVDSTEVMAFYLKDAVTDAVTEITTVSSIDASGFTIAAGSAEVRDTVSCAILDVDGVQYLYSPTGDFSTVEATDVFSDNSDQFVVLSRSPTKIFVAPATGTFEGPADLTADTATVLPVGGDQIDAAASSVSGRTRLTYSTGGPWAVAEGDVVVGGVAMTGLTSLSGALHNPQTIIDGLTFGVDVVTADIVDRRVRIINSTAGTTVFTTVVSVDSDAGTLTVADDAGDENDVVSITIYRSQVGYVDSVAGDDSYIDVVFPTVVADTDTFAVVVEQSDFSSIDFYPQMEVLVDFKVHRTDLAGSFYSASSVSELSEITGFTPDYRDGLSFTVAQATLAQDNAAPVYFIPVDMYQDVEDPTGGLSDQEELLGYTAALEVAESIDVYNIVAMSNLSSVQSAVVQHVNTMSDPAEKKERRGFLVFDVALGETESSTGVIYPGKTANGLAPSGVGGNKSLYDASISFVTEEDIETGDRVVVSGFGTFTSLVTTTDSQLDLSGDNWTVTKEALTATMSVTTTADIHAFTGASSGKYLLADVDDYIEATISGTTYRMRIVSVLANGTGFSAVDEVAGALSFAAATASSVTLIRSIKNVSWHANPLSKSNQVSATLARKTANSRRLTAMINQVPTVEINSTLSVDLTPELTASMVAAKRSGNDANQEVTNLYLGGGVTSVSYAHGYFNRNQLNSLAGGGFTLIAQEQSNSPPYIRDMITSSTSGQTVFTEELVTAIADKISKDLRATFVSRPGQALNKIDTRTIGIRHMQADAFFRSKLNQGYLNDYTINSIAQNSVNRRQLDIDVTLVIPVAEKEIEFTLNLTV